MGIDSTEGNGEERPGEGDPPEPSRGAGCWRDEQGRGGERMGMGEKKTLPAPDIPPCPRLAAVVPRWWAVVPHTTSGSTAQHAAATKQHGLARRKNKKARRESTPANGQDTPLQERAVPEATYV